MGYRKWLAIFITVVMILALFPAMAWAGNAGETGTDKYKSDASTMVIDGNVDGATYPYAAVPANAGTHYGVNTWINQTGSNTWDPEPTWIWESMPVVNPIDGDIVWFEKSFEVIGTPTAGALTIACDNGYAVWLNGKFVGNSATLPQFVGADLTDNHAYFEAMLGDLKQAFVTTSGWQTVGNFNLTPHLLEGNNVLTILGVNEYMNTDDANDPVGTELVNPGGLAFSFTVDWYREIPPTYGFCGYKYDAATGEGLEEWEIELYDEEGNYVESAFTNANGKYCFDGLSAGTYRASEVQQAGYTQIYPVPNEHIVVLPSGIVYGVESGTGDLYQIDVINQTETRLFEGAGSYLYPYPNGLAFDDVNDRIYFATNATELYFWEFGADDIVFAGTLTHPPANVCGAAFGGGYYWYIPDGSRILYKVTFDAAGIIIDQEAVATIGRAFTYGDIVIDYDDGMIYGSGIESYFTYDINNNVYWEAAGNDGSFLQIAWGSNGALYGHKGQREGVGTGHRNWYSIEPATGATTYEFTGDNLYVDLASGIRSYNFFNEEDRVLVCETAWGYGGEGIAFPNNEVVIDGVMNPSNAWGWTNWYGGGTLVMDLYAGAGQNDITKDDPVGTVTVTCDGEFATVVFQVDEGYEIDEAHVWLGDTELPLRPQGRFGTLTPTSAPGQFKDYVDYESVEYSEDGRTVTFVIEVDDCEFWVAAHAVVCWYE